MGIDAPQDTRVVLFPLVLVGFFFGLIALPIGIGLFLLAGPNPAFLYVATLALYYLSYESLHAVVHLPETHWINRIRWVAQRKAYHRRHHDPRWMSQCNFNISFPIADYLYGTARPDESNPAPAPSPGTRPCSDPNSVLTEGRVFAPVLGTRPSLGPDSGSAPGTVFWRRRLTSHSAGLEYCRMTVG